MEVGRQGRGDEREERTQSIVPLIWYGVEYMYYGAAIAVLLVLLEPGSGTRDDGLLPLSVGALVALLGSYLPRDRDRYIVTVLLVVLLALLCMEYLLGTRILDLLQVVPGAPQMGAIILTYGLLFLGQLWTIALVVAEMRVRKKRGERCNRGVIAFRLISFLLLFALIEIFA